MLIDFLTENHKRVLERVLLFDKIYNIINAKTDWGITEFILLYSLILDFKPEHILELGRAFGNSLYTISMAVDELRPKPKLVESVCLTKAIFKVKDVAEQDTGYRLNECIKIIKQDFLRYDYSAINNRDAILIFYDIHGIKVIKHFIKKFMPILQKKRHIVVFHDFSYDSKMTKEDFVDWRKKAPPEYKKHCFGEWDSPSGGGFIGFEEVPVLLEYINKNRLPIYLLYDDLAECLDKYYRKNLENISNYRKDFPTSLIAVRF